ncbi:MarR family transcriptional regulator [Actinophytocola xanthii]|uniref:MarR family transcriptional regulator n=2 Tax=Actinophytocola xanthii TaxID=1912961 RepID=A0A1Q8CS19_9PSEU|nr:MarR family transcriptional regulator [Actinophytocola xanthii]
MRDVPESGNDQVSARADDEVARFVERFALLLVEAGIARMPARVFGALLVAEDGTRTAAELTEQLRVSPAAISGAVRYLTQVGLISRGRHPGERRDHYEVTDDLWYEAYANRDKQLEQWALLLGDGAAIVGEDTRAGRRLAQSRQFFDFLRGEIDGMMRRWREYQREHGADSSR